MGAAAGLLEPVNQSAERRHARQLARGDGGIDPRQVLHHQAAGAEIGVADLGIAHLAIGQADKMLACFETAMRPALGQPPPNRQVGAGHRIVGAILTLPPPVEDAQHQRTRTGEGDHRSTFRGVDLSLYAKPRSLGTARRGRAKGKRGPTEISRLRWQLGSARNNRQSRWRPLPQQANNRLDPAKVIVDGGNFVLGAGMLACKTFRPRQTIECPKRDFDDFMRQRRTAVVPWIASSPRSRILRGPALPDLPAMRVFKLRDRGVDNLSPPRRK